MYNCKQNTVPPILTKPLRTLHPSLDDMIIMRPPVHFFFKWTQVNIMADNTGYWCIIACCPQQVLTMPKTDKVIKMTPSGFEDHLMLWSIAIDGGRNGLKLQLYCWWWCGSLLLSKYRCVLFFKYVIFHSNMISLSGEKNQTGIWSVCQLKRNLGYLRVGYLRVG